MGQPPFLVFVPSSDPKDTVFEPVSDGFETNCQFKHLINRHLGICLLISDIAKRPYSIYRNVKGHYGIVRFATVDAGKGDLCQWARLINKTLVGFDLFYS